MAVLAWEADRRRNARKDFCPDSPPITGSWADQARYGVFNRKSVKSNAKTPVIDIRSRTFDFDQMRMYAQHVISPDFLRKSTSQRAELLAIVRRLQGRCLTWSSGMNSADRAALQMAARALTLRQQ
jgi:hypothetical protein